MYPGYLTDVQGIKVGHNQSEIGMTGSTVVIYEEGATAGVDVRGSAPGTRETDIFKAEKMIDKIHAIVLSGGSAYGLDAASGVMKYLEEKGIGFNVGITTVPIVSSAVIFDLDIGDYKIRPDSTMGYKAAKSANNSQKLQGNIGAGIGATVGKILGPNNAMKAGLGSASIKVGELIVSALVVVNAFGDIYNHKNNRQIAGVYDYKNNKLLNTLNIMESQDNKLGFNVSNTTIGIIATNAKISKPQCNKIAQMGHNGYGKSINPVHTMIDGDTIFSMATNKIDADINLVGTLGSEVISRAITNAIVFAENVEGLKSYRNI